MTLPRLPIGRACGRNAPSRPAGGRRAPMRDGDLFAVDAPPIKELSLYDYQAAAIDRLRANIKAGHRRQLLVAPTGAGKTILAIALMQGATRAGSRSAFLADRTALIDQTSERLD